MAAWILNRIIFLQNGLLLFLILVIVMPIIYLTRLHFVGISDFFESDEYLIEKHANKKSIMLPAKMFNFIKLNTRPQSKFLVFRQSEFAFYVNRKLLHDIDPIMLNFYSIKNKTLAFQWLKKQNIDYVYVPHYLTPSIFNSQLYLILADPHLSTLLYEDKGFQLFKINKNLKDITVEKRENSTFKKELIHAGNIEDWEIQSYKFRDSFTNWKQIEDNQGNSSLSINNLKNDTIIMHSVPGSVFLSPRYTFHRSPIEPDKVYKLSTIVRGNGYIELLFIGYVNNEDGNLRFYARKIWESILTKKNQKVETIFTTPTNIKEYRLILKKSGKGPIIVNDIYIDKININNPNPYRIFVKTRTLNALYWETTFKLGINKYFLPVKKKAKTFYRN